jgi:hypothetical protein
MKHISEYSGSFLNHLEGFYRPGERDLAIELARALGLTVEEIRFTPTSNPIVAVHPNGDDMDPTNNVIFLFEMPEKLRRVLDLVEAKAESDAELRDAMQDYRDAVGAMPAMMPHFGLRFGSDDQLQTVVDRLRTGLGPDLEDRVSVFEAPRYQPVEGLPDIRQVFVRTNVFTMGAAGFEQAIELQVDRATA